MAKKQGKKSSLKVKDLGAKKNPKGGATELTIQKVVDKSSPILFSNVSTTTSKK